MAALPAEEQAVGREVAGGLQGRFAELETQVEQKQTQLVDALAERVLAAQREVDSLLATLSDPVGAVIDYARETVAGVLDTIRQMRDLLLNVLAKAAEAVDLILADPIGFVGNLAAGVKQGVQNFASNIGTHLQTGFFEWLFGALAGAGMQMPERFDLGGILSLVLQVLGLTWANIRRRAVAIVGKRVVAGLEAASEIVITLVTRGPAGLWEYIQEKAADLMQTVIDEIKSFLIERVVMAGVMWIVGLLNPASAFVKACKAIVDIVSWVMSNGQRILSFVNAVLDSVLAIARGQVGVAATAVEQSLAKAVPVAIGFLAGLLGLGGLSDKIREVMAKVQAPVNAAIDWLIHKAVGLVRAAGRLLGIGRPEQSGDDPEHAAKVTAGLTALHREERARLVNGKLPMDAAEAAIAAVMSRHPVFKSITLVDAGSKWRYDYVASPAEGEDGANKETISVEGTEYYVFRAKNGVVRIEYPAPEGEPAEVAAEINTRASYAKQIEVIMAGLEIDDDQADDLLRRLNVGPRVLEPLLLSFARRAGHPPEDYLVQELSRQTTQLRAAVSSPPTAERKATFVERGTGVDVLSDVALVFTQKPKSKWEQRPHGQRGGPKPAGEPVFHEWVWIGPDPPVEKHGVVRVDALGRVVEVVAVPDHIAGGAEKLIELMRRAGWMLAPNLR